jgi:hypothetical protein
MVVSIPEYGYGEADGKVGPLLALLVWEDLDSEVRWVLSTFRLYRQGVDTDDQGDRLLDRLECESLLNSRATRTDKKSRSAVKSFMAAGSLTLGGNLSVRIPAVYS